MRVTLSLASGHVFQVLAAGLQSLDYIESVACLHTFHRVAFWASQADHDEGAQPLHVHNFETQWTSPHQNPGERMRVILERHCKPEKIALHKWRKDTELPPPRPGLTDLHGILSHPAMTVFKAGA
jgi:hypothetical protein